MEKQKYFLMDNIEIKFFFLGCCDGSADKGSLSHKLDHIVWSPRPKQKLKEKTDST